MSIYIFWVSIWREAPWLTAKTNQKLEEKKKVNSINLYYMKHSKESDSMMIKTEASHASLLEFIKNKSVF